MGRLCPGIIDLHMYPVYALCVPIVRSQWHESSRKPYYMRFPVHNVTRQTLGRIRQNPMLRHSTVLFSGYLVAHVLNTLYQMVVSRTLAPVEYTLLAAFVSALLILQYPLMTLTTGLSRYSSILITDNRLGDVRRLLSRWLLRSGFAGIMLAMIGIWFRHPIGEMLHIYRTGPIIVAAVSLPAFLMLPIALGVSQGMQRFGWNASTTMAGSVVRLALGTFFVLCLFPTSGWGLLGHGAGVGFNVLALTLGLYWMLRKTASSPLALPHLRGFLLQSGLVQLAYATLMTADVILIKHFLPDELEFAYAATLGRLAVFLSSTIVIAMFPKVTATGRISRAQLDVFKQSVLYTAICGALAIAGCTLFPRLLLRILFGMRDPSRTMQAMVIAMTLIMSISAVLNTCLQFLVAQKRFLPTVWICIAAISYLAASALRHNHAWDILMWAALANGLALLALLPICWQSPIAPAPAESAS